MSLGQIFEDNYRTVRNEEALVDALATFESQWEGTEAFFAGFANLSDEEQLAELGKAKNITKAIFHAVHQQSIGGKLPIDKLVDIGIELNYAIVNHSNWQARFQNAGIPTDLSKLPSRLFHEQGSERTFVPEEDVKFIVLASHALGHGAKLESYRLQKRISSGESVFELKEDIVRLVDHMNLAKYIGYHNTSADYGLIFRECSDIAELLEPVRIGMIQEMLQTENLAVASKYGAIDLHFAQGITESFYTAILDALSIIEDPSIDITINFDGSAAYARHATTVIDNATRNTISILMLLLNIEPMNDYSKGQIIKKQSKDSAKIKKILASIEVLPHIELVTQYLSIYETKMERKLSNENLDNLRRIFKDSRIFNPILRLRKKSFDTRSERKSLTENFKQLILQKMETLVQNQDIVKALKKVVRKV